MIRRAFLKVVTLLACGRKLPAKKGCGLTLQMYEPKTHEWEVVLRPVRGYMQIDSVWYYRKTHDGDDQQNGPPV